MQSIGNYKTDAEIFVTHWCNIEFVTTQKGTHSLIYQIYKHTHNQKFLDGNVYWRIQNTSCSGRILTQDYELTFCSTIIHHQIIQLEVEQEISIFLRKKISESTYNQYISFIFYKAEIQYLTDRPNKDEIGANC